MNVQYKHRQKITTAYLRNSTRWLHQKSMDKETRDTVRDVNETVSKVEVEHSKAVPTSNRTKRTPEITLRNMIVTPSNCPPGFQRGADGICRETF
ncbi:unnamed protein product [Pieris brassicae]|uniref:Uncharacterized protein n=1 Tax=Pieris brassicae TaxID=7116 RepID=A0A9P0TSL1_PIEBR|nr:unnamed protein product [Pieris brassicae]CAH4037291.1 unnamed protein product [Pieris brassicae]